MPGIRPHTKYRRLYGKSITEIAKEMNIKDSSVSYLHTNGMLRHLELENPLAWVDHKITKIETKLKNLYRTIEKKCTDPKNSMYKYYGGRGIKNLLSLNDLEALWLRDKGSTLKKASIDRINNDGHYELSNCRFITASENSRKGNRPIKG